MFKPFQIRFLGYWLLFLILVLAGWLNLETPLLTVLFSYFVLEKLKFFRSKWLAGILFVVVVCGFFYLFAFFITEAIDALPKIIDESLPKIREYAQAKGITLPSDFEVLKRETIIWLRDKLGYLGNFAKIATKEFAFVLIGFVVAISIFVNPTLDLDRGKHAVTNNLYSFICEEIVARFRSFYESFAQVMGAQILISFLNTCFTAAYVLIVGLPYAALVIAVTFVCGLLPVIGNLMSNSIIVALSFRVSPQLAIASLIYLIVIHKLEYLLNSKIIGDRIRNPIWLTLLGLLIGERLMGIPGMVLAPVILNFIKVEASKIEMEKKAIEIEEPVEVRLLEK